MTDQVDHPSHYNSHGSGIECIQITEHMNFNLGNAVKYIWRAGLKAEDPITDLRKAAWYVQREITRLEDMAAKSSAAAKPAGFEDVCSAMRGLLDEADRRMASSKTAIAEAS